MANSLSLKSLLDSEKLTGPNFDSWYRKLRIVLEHERILYVLTDPAPADLAAGATAAERRAHQKWVDDRITVRCIMRAAMNDEFSRKFEDSQPQDIIQALNESFGTSDDAERHRTSCAIFSTKMREGTSVTDHVLYMTEHIEKLAKLGFPLHEQLGKDAILNSLPPSYLPFLNQFKMNKPVVNYHGLLGLLQTFEKDNHLLKKTVNSVGGASSSKSRNSSRSKRKRNGNSSKAQSGQQKSTQQKKSKVDKSLAECYFCKKKGH